MSNMAFPLTHWGAVEVADFAEILGPVEPPIVPLALNEALITSLRPVIISHGTEVVPIIDTIIDTSL